MCTWVCVRVYTPCLELSRQYVFTSLFAWAGFSTLPRSCRVQLLAFLFHSQLCDFHPTPKQEQQQNTEKQNCSVLKEPHKNVYCGLLFDFCSSCAGLQFSNFRLCFLPTIPSSPQLGPKYHLWQDFRGPHASYSLRLLDDLLNPGASSILDHVLSDRRQKTP